MLIDLHFNPKDANDYQDILTITDMDNNQYQVQLSGRAVDPVFYANVDTLTVVPFGDNLNGFGVKATFPALKYGAITNFKLEIEVNEELVEIKNINNTKPAGFTWKQAQKTGAGKYIVEGSGNLNTPFDDVFIIVEYKALLGAELVTPFKVRPLYTECPSDFTVPIHLAMNGICFNEGILINQGNFITDIQKVNPNPISTSTDLIFTTGYEAGTKLEIFDMQGNKVETLYDGRLPSGKYSVTLDVEKYNSGAYLLKLHSGHIIKTEKIIISK
jgi:hypothetical protein